MIFGAERCHEVDLFGSPIGLDLLLDPLVLSPLEALTHRHLLDEHENLLETDLLLTLQDQESVRVVDVQSAESQGLHEQVNVQDVLDWWGRYSCLN